MQKREFRPPVGAEIPAETEMDAGKNAVPDIAAHILPAGRRHGRIGGEQPHDALGRKLHRHADAQPEPGGDGNGPAQRLRGAAVFAGADVLRAQRRHGRKHRRRHQEQKADDLFHDAHGRRISQAAPVGKYGNEQKRDLDTPVLQRHRQTDLQQCAQHAALRTQVGAPQREAGTPPQHRRQRNPYAERLGQRRAQRRAGRPQPPRADEQVVQRDVGRAGHGNERQRAAGIAQPAEDGAQDIICRDAGDTQKADGQVAGGALGGFGRGGHDGDDGPHAGQQHRR